MPYVLIGLVVGVFVMAGVWWAIKTFITDPLAGIRGEEYVERVLGNKKK